MNETQLAFVFPGQGSQSPGMLADLGERYQSIGATFADASESLGYDLWKLVQENPDDKLNKTEYTQPALLTSSYAIWRIWQELSGPEPLVLAGHSLGEYTALVCSGVLSLAEGVSLVSDRGKYMQEAVPEGSGAMAAILGLDNDKVLQVCKAITSASAIVSPANYNTDGQVVIAGHKDAVEKATELAKESGAKRAMLLPVSVPSHCALMSEAAERMADRMEQITFRKASIPIIQNVDVLERTEPEQIKKALLEQLYKPVRWVETVEKMKAMRVTRIIECGPGKVLTGLVKRIDRSIEAEALFDVNSLETALSGGQS